MTSEKREHLYKNRDALYSERLIDLQAPFGTVLNIAPENKVGHQPTFFLYNGKEVYEFKEE